MSVRACFGRAKAVVRLAVARLREASARGFSKFAGLDAVCRFVNPRRAAVRTYLDGDVRQGSVDGLADATHAAGCDAAGHDGWVPERRARVGESGAGRSWHTGFKHIHHLRVIY